MTIRHLHIFRTVCEYKSITAAADKLNMTQPAVSIAIRELESYYQVRLFDRMNRTIYLTEAGSTLREYADTVLDQFEEAASVLRDGSRFTRCRLGVNVSVGETVLSGIIKALRRELPRLRLEVRVENITSIERRLNENEIDFAVVDSLGDEGRQNVIPLYRGEMAAVCAPSYGPEGSVTVRELAEYELLLREKGSGSRTCTDAAFEAHGVSARPAVESISDLSLLKLAKAGLGITIMPRELVLEQIESGELKEIPLLDEKLVRRYFLVYSKKKYLTAAMRQAAAVLEAYCRDGRAFE